MAELSNHEINNIIEAAKETRDNSEVDMLKIKDEVKVDESAELESDTKIEGIGGNASDLIAVTVDTMPAANVSLFDLEGDTIKDSSANISDEAISSIAKDNYDLTDDEIMNLLTTISEMKKDPNYPIYKNLPEKIKGIIREIAAKNGIPSSQFNGIAKMVMVEFLNDSEIEAAFIDLEKSLKEALNMPSITDLYTEHTRKVMEENIPKMIEEIKDVEPEKAKLLEGVKKSFEDSYSFSFAKNEYETNTRLRKSIRKFDKSFKRTLEEFNFMNNKSNFKMYDVRELPDILNHILIAEPESIIDTFTKDGMEIPEVVNRLSSLKITETDICKFCILICKSCENLDPRDIIDASYMYYMIKNIIVLKHTREAKTEFAAELINNICDIITFIRNKEAEFNAANMDKSKL